MERAGIDIPKPSFFPGAKWRGLGRYFCPPAHRDLSLSLSLSISLSLSLSPCPVLSLGMSPPLRRITKQKHVKVEEGKYYLEDHTGQVSLDLSRASLLTDGFVTENSIVLVQGEAVDGVLHVHHMGECSPNRCAFFAFAMFISFPRTRLNVPRLCRAADVACLYM